MRVWELALAFEIDEALWRGDLFLARSRDHRSFWDLVHSPARWQVERDRAYVAMQLPMRTEDALDALRVEFDDSAERLLAGFSENRFPAIEGDHMVLRRRDALEISKNLRELRRAVETHMPEIGIEDVLVEVDRRCRFTRELTPLGTYTPRVDNLYPALLATLLAQCSSVLGSFYPRYFGFYECAVGVYTHVSDQHSVFASRVISCAPREALYVLDSLLENDTVLAPRAHTTDTHGSTEQMFALCYLLGLVHAASRRPRGRPALPT
jgi:hypothetical protein